MDEKALQSMLKEIIKEELSEINQMISALVHNSEIHGALLKKLENNSEMHSMILKEHSESLKKLEQTCDRHAVELVKHGETLENIANDIEEIKDDLYAKDQIILKNTKDIIHLQQRRS